MFETIFKRRSVRKYDPAQIAEEELKKIKEYLLSLSPLDGCSARFEIVVKDAVLDKMAPHYILAYAENDDKNLINIGYILENVDLFLQKNGYGACWLGMVKPSEKEEDYVICLAFGKTQTPLRSGEKDFSRLPVAKISNSSSEIVKAIRLAPSAVNSQPWYIKEDEGSLQIEYTGRGLMKALLKRFNKIDLGIALCHALISLSHYGKIVKKIEIENLKIKIEYGSNR